MKAEEAVKIPVGTGDAETPGIPLEEGALNLPGTGIGEGVGNPIADAAEPVAAPEPSRPRHAAARRRRDLVLGARVAATALAETLGFVAIMLVPGGKGLALGLALHFLAAMLGRIAARRRRKDLTQVESDLVLLTGVMVPLFGPFAAWALPRGPEPEEPRREPRAAQAVAAGKHPAGEDPAAAGPADRSPVGEAARAAGPANAHDVFASYSDHVKPVVPDHERTLFTGVYEKDMARELDVESYHEVLVHGTTDQKRSALHRLAELGEPKHFRLIRQCLVDLEHEVRLYAYSELEKASRHYEEEIAQRVKELKERPQEGAPLLAIARAYFEYAATGIHDEQMGAWYYKSAEQNAGQARRLMGDDPEPVWIQARAFGRLGEYDRAKSLLLELSESQQNLPESCLARAELAYARRDFLAARAEAARLREAGEEPPPWLVALEGKRR